jgi:hypothetical protein
MREKVQKKTAYGDPILLKKIHSNSRGNRKRKKPIVNNIGK